MSLVEDLITAPAGRLGASAQNALEFARFGGFETDEHGDWVARLGCGHAQHVRHRPPFQNRPWVTTEAGRSEKLGVMLDCVRCDASELPPHFVAYKRTPTFTETSVPSGLLADHTTKPGVWATIVVLEGALRYCVDALGAVRDLVPGAIGVAVPEVRHHVAPIGRVGPVTSEVLRLRRTTQPTKRRSTPRRTRMVLVFC